MNHAEIAFIVNKILTDKDADTEELLLRFEKNIRDREAKMEEVVIYGTCDTIKDNDDDIALTESVFKEYGLLGITIKDI